MTPNTRSAGRPREFEEADVLDNVMTLFWTQGYEGTGMSDIMSATGLAKGSLYKAFQNKHNLYLKSLERYEDIYVDKAVIALTSSRPPLERLEAFLSAPLKDMSSVGTSRGCFLCNASADRASLDKETRALVRRGFKKLAKALAKLVTELKPNWTPSQIEQSAHMLLSVYSGLRTMSRSGADKTGLKAAKDGALAVLG